MTAEQFMDSIWQLTGTNPTKIEAKVDRAIRDDSSAKADPCVPSLEKSPQNGSGVNPNAKDQIEKMIKLDSKPSCIFSRYLRQCFFPPDQREKGDFVKEWTKPVYQQTASFFKKGDNLIEVDAEMFGGASGFVAQFILGKDKMLVETDKTWEVAEGKQWKAATEVHSYGKGPWKRVLDNAIESKTGTTPGAGPPIRAALVKNDFLMRSLGRPHPDQVVTSRPAELTTLQAIDLANGQILADYLSKGARALEGKKNRPENGSIGSSAMPWPASHRPRRKAFSRRWRPNPQATRKWKTFFGWSSCIRISNHTLSTMNLPESIIRRDFIKQLGVASAAALATEGTKAWANEAVKHPEAKADSCILIWLAGGMAAPDTFDPKALPSVRGGLGHEQDPQHLSRDRHQRGRAEDHQRLGEYRSGHGPRNAHPFGFSTGFGLDPSFPPSIPLAYRIVPPLTVAAPHLGAWMAKVLRTEKRDRSAFHQYRPASRGRGRKGGTEGFYHRRIFPGPNTGP